ncbi:MFS general substrate transporter [Artomyces pyxidatus]|uniref:MFS general substrate transporter n=1 Tax=Artomyces pyxidatus TaxID=48021 RepID=A0ACB8TJM4_9AGAM|nr:MFS general substrate transporter [Artomyces pyxidatus]
MANMSSSFDDIKLGGVSVDYKDVDTGAQLVAGTSPVLDEIEALRIRRKIDRHLIPLMSLLYLVQFMDKATLGSSVLLGLRESTHIDTSQYNLLGTVFYIGYLAFEYPQSLALQRFPVGKWISFNVVVWAIVVCCHAACTNFQGLVVCRLILGLCEGSITAGFLLVSSMFYTRKEQTSRIGYWFLMNGTAQIVTGFVSFGSLHIVTKGFAPWQWLMIITGLVTLITAALYYFYFPDSPTSAWFLTLEERIKAVERIKENQTGIENKRFKREQMMEALTDPKTWLFAMFAAVNSVPGSITAQRQIIVASFGFSNLQTTLLGCVDGVVDIVTILTSVAIVSRIPNSLGYVGMAYIIPNLVGIFLVNFLPWKDKVGLLFGQWIAGAGTAGFVLGLSWVNQTTAGHTKKVTVNAILLSSYCVGNIASPFMWLAKFKPRNHIPWVVIGCCNLIGIALLLSVRVLLASRNRRRNAETRDSTYDNVYITKLDAEGKPVEVRIDKAFLDLTDIQNRDFRYVL